MSKFARRWSGSLVLGLGLALGASAQDPPKSGEAQSSVSAADFPFEGEVICESLNVRLAPRLDAASGVVAVLKQGEKVVAVGTSGEFLVVKAPRGATAWIYGRHIKKEGEGAGIVLVNDAPLRMDSRAGAEKIGSLKEGDRVDIVKEHLGWFKVAAPAGVKYYVAKKYVRFNAALPDEPAEAVSKPSSIPEGSAKSDAAALAKMKEAEGLVAAETEKINNRQFTELDYSAAVAAFQEAANLAKSETVMKQAEAKAESYGGFNNMIRVLGKNIEAIEKLLAAQKEAREKGREIPASKWAACGYVDTVGPLFYRPGAFKLMMSGKIVAFIKVPDGDEEARLRMNRLYGRYVGVTGPVLKNPPGWQDHIVVTLETVEELVKP